jgi:hypothetical protein
MRSGIGSVIREILDSEDYRERIFALISETGNVKAKGSNSILDPMLCDGLKRRGYFPSKERLPSSSLPIAWWRHPDTLEPINGKGRTADIAVRDKTGNLIAVIECESDVSDIPEAGRERKKRGGHSGNYYVKSLARNSHGEHYASYLSLERMAVLALSAQYPHLGGSELRDILTVIASSAVREHNPKGLELFLVLEFNHEIERHNIIGPRLSSLGASLVLGSRPITANN